MGLEEGRSPVGAEGGEPNQDQPNDLRGRERPLGSQKTGRMR